VVAQKNELVLVDDGRAAVAPVDLERAVVGSQMFLPNELPCQIERRYLAGRKPRVYALAVGHWTRRCEVVFLVNRRKRRFSRKLEFPDSATTGAIKRADEEEDFASAAGRTGSERPLAGLQRIAALHQPRAGTHDTVPDLRRHEDQVAPDDGRRNTESAERRLPGDVLALTPSKRKPLFRRDA
jgi:hypothetical protein